MIALLLGLQNILVALHNLWIFCQLKCSSINFNTSFQWLIILEEFYYITKKLDCHWLYELRDCCASCCCKSATRAPNFAISFVSNQPCGFVNTPCVLPNTPHDFSPNPPSNFPIQPCVFPNPPGNSQNQVRVFLYSLKFIEEHLSWEKEQKWCNITRIFCSPYNSAIIIIFFLRITDNFLCGGLSGGLDVSKVTFELCKHLDPNFFELSKFAILRFFFKPTDPYEAIAALNGSLARF